MIVTDVLECSMVLTMQIKRTFKLLCAVGLGRPIVGPGWVQACADTNMIVGKLHFVLLSVLYRTHTMCLGLVTES